MQNMIDTVIWDMGGVLIRTEDFSPRQELANWLDMSEKELYSLVFNSETAQKATLGQIPEEEQWNTIQNLLKLGDQDMQDFRDAFWGGDRLDKELMNFIQSLRPRFRTALLSNAWSGARAQMEIKFNLLSAFDVSIFSAEIGLAKPDPAIYTYLLEKLAVVPEKTVFVDDVKDNVESAMLLGMHGIVFTNRQQVLDDLAFLHVTQ